MTTFTIKDQPVSEWLVKRRPEMRPWMEQVSVPQSREKGLPGKTLYALGSDTVGGRAPLFTALSYAFNHHVPLVLTPDSIWLTMLTGLTHHIDQDPEGLRRSFVAHEGKKTLEIRLGGSLASMTPDAWHYTIRGFSEQLQANIHKGRHPLIIANFSTTSETDRLASEVALMGAMKHFFEYRMMLCCGLNQVTVLGTSADWADIIDRTNALAEFGLSWWSEQAVPVLREIKRACEGAPNTEFWERAYLEHRVGSGGQFNVSGWINAFYPYLAGSKPGQMVRNPHIAWEANQKRGADPDDFPLGLIQAPVSINDNGAQHQAVFYGGLTGVSMAEDMSTKPESGLAVQLIQ